MFLSYAWTKDTIPCGMLSTPTDGSGEEKPWGILDYDRDGNVVGIEILDALKRVKNPRSFEYAVAG